MSDMAVVLDKVNNPPPAIVSRACSDYYREWANGTRGNEPETRARCIAEGKEGKQRFNEWWSNATDNQRERYVLELKGALRWHFRDMPKR